jgi:predicted lactoylglutathione lyase
MTVRKVNRRRAFFVEGDSETGVCFEGDAVEETLAEFWRRADKSGSTWTPPVVYIGRFTGEIRDPDDHVFGWFVSGGVAYPVQRSIPDMTSLDPS